MSGESNALHACFATRCFPSCILYFQRDERSSSSPQASRSVTEDRGGKGSDLATTMTLFLWLM